MVALQQQREALTTAASGLEALLRLQGVDVEQLKAKEVTIDTKATPQLGGVLGSVVATLAAANASMGAKAIQQALRERGIVTNYHTLYKSLKREATKHKGVIAQMGEKFGLREWANTDTGTDR